MKRSRFTEEQIIGMLKEQEAGMPTAEVCRKHGISSATFYKCTFYKCTFYKWKAKYGGLELSDARKLKALEDENAKLKKLLAEAMLDNAILKDVAAKNGDARRERAIDSGWDAHDDAGKISNRWITHRKCTRTREGPNEGPA